jgi:hypothetical protein
MAARMKIATFREAVNRLNFIRCDLSGHTRDEYKKRIVPLVYEDAIESLEALIPLLGSRFTDDLESANSALRQARACIDRWHSVQDKQPLASTTAAKKMGVSHVIGNVAYLGFN